MEFKIYVDFTLEETPRPFYVGKGQDDRIKYLKRNNYHKNIKNKYGLRRDVIFETDDEKEAFKKEKEMIKEYKTFVYAIDYVFGANFTEGGEGVSGYKHTDEARKKTAAAQKGRKHSLEHRKKNSDGNKGKIPHNKGKKSSFETCEKISKAGKGRKHSLESRKKISENNKGKPSPGKGKKWIKNIELNQCKFIKQSELDSYFSFGWEFGRLKTN